LYRSVQEKKCLSKREEREIPTRLAKNKDRSNVQTTNEIAEDNCLFSNKYI
jgi:hypothetical protein